MNKTTIKSALRFRMKSNLQAVGVLVGVVALVVLSIILGVTTFRFEGFSENVTLSMFGFAAIIFSFVMGITTVREDLRLFIQHGIGRKTTFIVNLLATAITSLVLAVACCIFIQLPAVFNTSVTLTDIYQQMFFRDTIGHALPFADLMVCGLLCFVVCCCAQLSGIIVSLVYYRVNRFWTVVISIAVPLFFIVGVPFLTASAPGGGPTIPASLLLSPWFAIAVGAAIALVFACLVWPLMRKVAITPAGA